MILESVDERGVSSDGTVVFRDLAPGRYRLRLTGLGPGCSAERGVTRDYAVLAGVEVLADFVVLCGDDLPLLFWTHPLCTDPVSCPGGRPRAYTDLFTIRADGSRQLPVTATSPEWEYDPAWSPDGRHIAFVRSTDGHDVLMIMAADGTDVRRLTHTAADERSPAWSPDGTTLAFQRRWPGASEVWLIGPSGGDERHVIAGFPMEDLAWAPSGEELVGTTGGAIGRLAVDGSLAGPIFARSYPARDPAW